MSSRCKRSVISKDLEIQMANGNQKYLRICSTEALTFRNFTIKTLIKYVKQKYHCQRFGFVILFARLGSMRRWLPNNNTYIIIDEEEVKRTTNRANINDPRENHLMKKFYRTIFLICTDKTSYEKEMLRGTFCFSLLSLSFLYWIKGMRIFEWKLN